MDCHALEGLYFYYWTGEPAFWELKNGVPGRLLFCFATTMLRGVCVFSFASLCFVLLLPCDTTVSSTGEDTRDTRAPDGLLLYC